MSLSASMVVLLLSLGETPPPPQPAAPACSLSRFDFNECLVLTLGLGAFGEVFPLSSVKAPGTERPQRSLLGGARFWLGTRWPNHLALKGVFEIGYATVGPFPGRGVDGLVEGAGLELSLDTFALVKPFVRFMYNAIVLRFPSMVGVAPSDELKANAFSFAAGAQVSIVEVHLSVARDLAGGVGPGLGFSVNWTYP
jgi:hypothetical protein